MSSPFSGKLTLGQLAQIISYIVVAAVSYGVLYGKMSATRSDIAEIRTELSAINGRLDLISSKQVSSSKQ